MKYKLLVVTVTYKSNLEELELFVNSFKKYNDIGDSAKLIVVDNSPKDFCDVHLLLNKYPDVDYLSNPTNPGFGASNNKGFEAYDSEFVLFINNDVEFISPVFSKIIRIFSGEPNLGCVGIHQVGGSPSFFRKMNAPGNQQMKMFDDKFHFISGAFMFFRSEIFEKIGKFDENIFMYYEEFDLSCRLLENGYYTRYLPDLDFWHKVGNRRKINVITSKIGIPPFFYVCSKYNLNSRKIAKSKILRLRKLQLYFLLKFDIKEVKKIQQVICYWNDALINI